LRLRITMLAYWYDCHTRDPHAHREAPSRKAAERGQSKSSVVRKALEAALTRDRKPRARSFASLAHDLTGCVSGPIDLSHHPRHLHEYGR